MLDNHLLVENMCLRIVKLRVLVIETKHGSVVQLGEDCCRLLFQRSPEEIEW